MSDSTPAIAPPQISRRRFLGSQAAMAAIVATPLLESAAHAFGAEPAAEVTPDYYDKLGVTKFINAAGTYTVLTSATMPPVVQAAVAQAAKHPVHLEELQRKAGEYIASKLKCEGALVSCGASSALTLATAACVQAANQCSIMDIPQEIGSSKFPKNEVIMQKGQRYGYDHGMYLCGIKIVEVVTLDDYKKAFNANTVMTNFLNAADGGEIGEEEWLSVAHQHNVPCHLDAAADMPPISNLWKYTGMGFDLVCFSGGKAIRGPQNAGLLLGKKKLIDLAAKNNNPGDGVGRGMKVAKEQLVGMVAAVDWLLAQTDESMEQEARRKAAVIIGMVKGIPSVETSIFMPAFANHFPQLFVTFDPKVIGIDIREARQRLLTGSPSIELNPHTGSARPSQGVPATPNSLVVVTSFMADGEEQQVGEQISKLLKDPKSVGHLPPGGMPAAPARSGTGA
jgi:uncharacterized pyridoxal phosphate-dependent enzyme